MNRTVRHSGMPSASTRGSISTVIHRLCVTSPTLISPRYLPGGMVTFDVRGGEEQAFRFLNALKLVKLAVSLGGTESLAEHPSTMTHADVPPEDQKRMGILPSMVRLSIGVEHPQDVIADLEQALAEV